VNLWWLRAAGAEDSVRPRRLIGRFWAALNFTVRVHRVPRLALVLAFVSAGALGACDPHQQTITDRAESDTVQDVKADDPAMLLAFAKARQTLGPFLARLAAKDPAITQPVMKVKIQDGDAVEYFWVASPTITGELYSGTINNDPELVRTVHNGQVIYFQKSEIYDWSHRDAKTSKMVGNFTACALLTHESQESAVEFKRTYQLDCDP
jgi:uncharacterized protein YegJ (DUF2314 family)